VHKKLSKNDEIRINFCLILEEEKKKKRLNMYCRTPLSGCSRQEGSDELDI
jgi:hypothetical protein